MHIILTGATGKVGSAVLHEALLNPAVTKLTILSRRQFGIPTEQGLDASKAKIVIHEDYMTYPQSLVDDLKGADACIWAQGVSQNDVTKEDYIQITYECPMSAAKAFATLNETRFKFIYISGEGADPSERSLLLFGNIKGRTETALLALATLPENDHLKVYNVRPGWVDGHSPFQKPETGIGATIMERGLGPIMRKVLPNQVSPAPVLGKALVKLAVGDGEPIASKGNDVEAEGRTLRSAAIRRLGI